MVRFNDGFCSMTNCRNRRRIVMEHWPKPIAKRCTTRCTAARSEGPAFCSFVRSFFRSFEFVHSHSQCVRVLRQSVGRLSSAPVRLLTHSLSPLFLSFCRSLNTMGQMTQSSPLCYIFPPPARTGNKRPWKRQLCSARRVPTVGKAAAFYMQRRGGRRAPAGRQSSSNNPAPPRGNNP